MNTDNQQRIAKVVAKYKGLDEAIFLSCEEVARNDFGRRLFKELAILGETAAEGGGKEVSEILRRFSEEGSISFDEAEASLNAQIEFGKSYAALTDKEKGIVDRRELEQESCHFSRIMGLDRILLKQDKVPTDQDFFNDASDFARFMNLVIERQETRGVARELASDFGVDAGGDVAMNERFGVMQASKGDTIAVTAVAYFDPENRDIAKDLLVTMAKYLVKQPFAIATALTDYYAMLRYPEGTGVAMQAIQETREKGRHVARFFRIGASSAVALKKKENGQFYEREVAFWNSGHSTATLGMPRSADYGYTLIDLPERGSMVLLDAESAGVIRSLDSANLDDLLNRPDDHKKVLAYNNIAGYLKERKVAGCLVNLNFGSVKERKELVWDESTVDAALAEIEIDAALADAPLINVEAGHVHADRELSQLQKDGVAIAVGFLRKLGRQSGTPVRKMAMVDEYHVVNNLDYRDYAETLDRLGFVNADVVLESSPLIKEIAVDLLKKFIREAGPESGFSVDVEQDNIYLRLKDTDRVVELIEGVSRNFVVGCVLFDAAFSYFKRYENEARKVYAQIHGLDGDYDIHKEMIAIYDKIDDPGQRKAVVAETIPLQKFSLEGVRQTLQETRYLDAFSQSPMKNAVLLNILESFYRPQQAKLNRVLGLLGEQGVRSLYFNPDGSLLMETSKISDFHVHSDGGAHQCGAHH